MKRTHKAVRNKILETLSDSKEYVYGDLERKVGTNWQTIRDHCEELELYGLITSKKEGKITSIKITKQGLEILKKLKE